MTRPVNVLITNSLSFPAHGKVRWVVSYRRGSVTLHLTPYEGADRRYVQVNLYLPIVQSYVSSDP